MGAMPIVTIKLKGRPIGPHRTVVGPLLGARHVLTKAPWQFVSLWLRREKRDDALFYWQQSQEFYNASVGLPVQSRPLLLYYSFMNAAKALFTAKRITFNEHHGVKNYPMRPPNARVRLGNEGVKLLSHGVLPTLSTYYGESESLRRYSLEELFFNTVFIHRTYCLTHPRQTEMFISLTDCEYVADNKAKRAFFRASLSEHYASQHVVNRLPSSFRADADGDPFTIRSTASVPFSKPGKPTKSDLRNLVGLNNQLRTDLVYIRGAKALWYVKTNASGPRRVARQTPTVVLAAMHRLSEICRYRPLELRSLLSGRENWLVSEFVEKSPLQFIDAMASEVTGYEFLEPNIRTPS